MLTETSNPQAQNIQPGDPGLPPWNKNDIAASLQAILLYVESEAGKSIRWYWKNKKSKAISSQVIRLGAFSLTALGGLFPVAIVMINPVLIQFDPKYKVPESGLVSSLCVGLAAGLYGLDKAFGFSSGWTRYVLTATVLEKTLEEFKLNWTLQMSKAGNAPSAEQIEALLKCAQDFRTSVSAAVLQETKDWVTEFQNNLGELERDTRAQLDSLRAKVDLAVASKPEENNPGAVELTVTDAAHTDGFCFQVDMEADGVVALKETVVSSTDWAAVGIKPGQYRLRVTGSVGGQPAVATRVLVVKASETAALQMQLKPA